MYKMKKAAAIILAGVMLCQPVTPLYATEYSSAAGKTTETQEIQKNEEIEKENLEDVDASLSKFVEDVSDMKQYDEGKSFISDIMIDTSEGTLVYEGELMEDVIQCQEDGYSMNQDVVSTIAADNGVELPDKENITIGDFAECLGAEVTENEDGKVLLKKDYQTCRIIVKSTEQIWDDKAIAVSDGYNDIYVLQYENEDIAKEACEAFGKLDYVKYAEPDRIQSTLGMEYTDYDTWGAEECGFDEIKSQIVNTYGSEENVPDVVVAVIDSGLDLTHEAFTGRLAENGYDFTNDDGDVTDDNGHGTAVSGVITMNTPDYVKVLPIKASNSEGIFQTTDVYAAIEYAIEKKVDIINMSFGGYGLDLTEQEAISDAYSAGISMVAGYGNDSIATDNIYPACFDEVIAVSSVANTQVLSVFSNYGNKVDIAAPGTGIYTATPSYINGTDYSHMDGTSLSTPFVAAGLALVRALNQEAGQKELADILYANAVDLGEEGWDEYFGNGMLCFDNYQNSRCEAKIGEEKYTTLEEAFSEAVDGDIVRICADVVLEQTLVCDKTITIVSDRDYTIYRGNSFTGEIFRVKDGGSLALGYSGDKKKDVQLTIDGTIYCEGSLVISGQAGITPENDIYLSEGAYITVTDAPKADSLIAVLSLENYTDGTCVVVYDDNLTPVRNPFRLKNTGYSLHIDGQRLVVTGQSEYPVRIGDTTYDSLEEAISAAQPDDVLEILKDIEVGSTIEISKNITICADNERWITRKSGFLGDMVAVKNGAVCSIKGDAEKNQKLYFSGKGIRADGSILKVESDSTLNMDHVYLTGQNSNGTGVAAICNQGIVNLMETEITENSGVQGAAIYNAGECTLNDVVITFNSAASDAGAIYNSGSLIMNSGKIDNNTAVNNGGGIYSTGTFTMNAGSISHNICSYYSIEEWDFSDGSLGTGGGLWNSGVATINSGEIVGNNVGYNGGGIMNYGKGELDEEGNLKNICGTLYINGGTIADNIASHTYGVGVVSTCGYGGGICNRGELYMTGGSVNDNSALMGGAGIENAYKFTMTGGSITNNVVMHREIFGYGTYDGTAICNDWWTFNYNFTPSASVTGGYISGDVNDPYNPTIYVGGGTLDIGGDIRFGKNCVIDLNWNYYNEVAIIKVIKEFTNDFPALLLTSSHKEVGDSMVTYSDGIEPDTNRFQDYMARKLKVDGQNLVLTDEIADVFVNGTCGETLSWNLQNHILTISGEGKMNSYAQESDVPWNRYKLTIYSIVVEEGCTEIGDNAFAGLTNVKDIQLCSGLQNMGYHSCYNCSSLTTIEIPDSMYSIGQESFRGCTSLLEINVGENNKQYESQDGVLFRKGKYALVRYPQAKTDETFSFPDETTLIDDYYAFSECKYLKEVIASKNMEIIGAYGFADCSSLESVVLQEGLEAIEVGAFASCSSLKNVYIPESVISIAEDAFYKTTAGEKGFTIYGARGSYTETYAKDKGYLFTPKKDIADCVVKMDNEFEYNGNAICPAVVISDTDGNQLNEGIDYDLTYTNNIKVGTAKITITGKRKYLGTLVKTFTIGKIPVNTITLSVGTFTYDGTAKTPKVTVTDEKGRVIGTGNYTVSYNNNINAGTATVTVVMKGNYTGTITKKFTISKVAAKTVTLSSTSYTYNGVEKKPSVTVKDGSGKVIPSSNYTVNYSNNINAGSATVKVVMKGNYTGTLTKTFTIGKAANKITVSGSYSKTASSKTQSFYLGAKAAGGKLTYKSDNKYVTVSTTGKVTIANNFAGKATITVSASGTNHKYVVKKVTITVKPGKTSISGIKNTTGRKLSVYWSKLSYVSGYQIQYGTRSDFKGAKTVTISGASKSGKVLSELTKGKTYYVRIRTYKTVGTTKLYSEWSAKKSMKITK